MTPPPHATCAESRGYPRPPGRRFDLRRGLVLVPEVLLVCLKLLLHVPVVAPRISVDGRS